MDTATRTAIDQHLILAKSVMYNAISGGSLEIKPHWVRAYSGLQLPTFNIFVPLDAKGLTDDTLADTSAFFFSRNVHYVVEVVHDQFPDGPDYLTKLRYQSLPPQPAMLLNAGHDEVELNQEVMVERVTTVPSLTAFCTTLHAVFDFPLKDLTKFYPARHFEDPRIKHYLAFLDEQPVGAGTIICADGIASVWNVCTIDQYRQRGVATTLLHAMLVDASEFGADKTVLFSTAHAFHLFKRFGFGIYTQRQWFLPPGIDYEE